MPLTIRDGRLALAEVLTDRCNRQSDMKYSGTRKADKKDSHTVLRAKEVWFRYERSGVDIFRSLDLSLYKGEMFALLGGERSREKHIIKNTDRNYKRAARQSNREKGERIAMLPQSPQVLFQYDTVWEELLESAGQDVERAKEMQNFWSFQIRFPCIHMT